MIKETTPKLITKDMEIEKLKLQQQKNEYKIETLINKIATLEIAIERIAMQRWK